MALSVEEFLRRREDVQKRESARDADLKEIEDRYWDDLSDLVEQHPPVLPIQYR